MPELTSDPADNLHSDEMTPGRAAFETWYASIAGINLTEVTPDAWRGMGDHKALWDRVAEAAITVYEDPEGLGPIARDMAPDELAAFRARRAKD